MSGFGGFCPLPIRLGGGATDGLTATQHARAAADLVAALNVAEFGIVTFDKLGSTFTLYAFNGVMGVGPAWAPTFTDLGNGATRITFGKVTEDEYETVDTVAIFSAEATAHGSSAATATVVCNGRNVVDVYTFDGTGTAADLKVTVVLGEWTRRSKIGTYDAATDKEDTRTEIIPYAAAWYEEETSALGSAYTQNKTGMVHATKIANARLYCSMQRHAEKMTANSHPDTADDMLGEWVQLLQLRYSPDDTRHEIRQRAAAKFKAAKGNDRATVDNVLAELLGPYFNSVIRYDADPLSTPTAPTYWPTISPGAPTWNIGGGAWSSIRANVNVLTDRPDDVFDGSFRRLVDVELTSELDRLLPCWATFDWSSVATTGFYLDVSAMDFDTFD